MSLQKLTLEQKAENIKKSKQNWSALNMKEYMRKYREEHPKYVDTERERAKAYYHTRKQAV